MDDVFPKSETGYFHLTPEGWVRQDQTPFPPDRRETWLYEMECPYEDAKEQVTLTRIWASPSGEPAEVESLRARFGEPVTPTPVRSVKLACQV